MAKILDDDERLNRKAGSFIRDMIKDPLHDPKACEALQKRLELERRLMEGGHA